MINYLYLVKYLSIETLAVTLIFWMINLKKGLIMLLVNSIWFIYILFTKKVVLSNSDILNFLVILVLIVREPLRILSLNIGNISQNLYLLSLNEADCDYYTYEYLLLFRNVTNVDSENSWLLGKIVSYKVVISWYYSWLKRSFTKSV